MDRLELAKLTQFNEKAEAQAIFDYTEFINTIKEMTDIPEDEKVKLIDSIEELIADELNHQQVLQEMYVYLTNIQPNEK